MEWILITIFILVFGGFLYIAGAVRRIERHLAAIEHKSDEIDSEVYDLTEKISETAGKLTDAIWAKRD